MKNDKKDKNDKVEFVSPFSGVEKGGEEKGGEVQMGERVMEKTANPAPLGFLGFGMAMVLFNLYNAEFIDMSVVVVAMGFALGGLAQIIAGVFELRRGNTFGGTAFAAYGLFWWSLIFIWLNPGEMMDEADEFSMGYYLLLWGVFTLFMLIGALRQNRAVQVVLLTLAILFFGLAAFNFTGIEIISYVAGFVGIVCGASALYASFGIILKEEYGREVLRICEPKGKDAQG